MNELPGLQTNCTTISIAQIETGNQFQLYPNPACDYVNIELANSKIRPKSLKVINQLGQVIKEISIINDDKINITTSEIPVGLYIVEIMSIDNHKLIKKLIIK